MTKHTLKWFCLFTHHTHKLQPSLTVEQWPLTDVHQCNTYAALSKVYLEEPGHMPNSLNQQIMWGHPLHTFRFSQKFSSEWKFDPWLCDLDVFTLVTFQLWFHYFSSFFSKALRIHLSWKTKKWWSSIKKNTL